MSNINDLCLHFLQDIYYAERQIVKTIPKMVKAAQNEQLKQALMQHREETEHQIERLQQVFEQMGKRARAKTCEAIQGILEEGEEVISEFEAGPVRDAGLLANAQAIEHYEMARYGSLVAWTKAAGMTEASALLEQTLAEEKKADSLLTQIANGEVNKQAASKAKAA